MNYNNTGSTLDLLRRYRRETVSLAIPKGHGIRVAIAGASMMIDHQILCTGSLKYDHPEIGVRELEYMIAEVQLDIELHDICCEYDLDDDYIHDEFNQTFGMGIIMYHSSIKFYDKMSTGVLCDDNAVIVSKRMSTGVYRVMVIAETASRWVDAPVNWRRFPWRDIVESETFREIFSETY